MTKKASLAAPGDILGSAEEFTPGSGAFEENGYVRASVMGEVALDAGERAAGVRPARPEPASCAPGDIVYGRISSLRGQLASVELLAVEGRPRAFFGGAAGTLHVSKVDTRFVSDITRCFGPNDIIRARVVRSAPSVQLGTASPDLGIVRGRCGFCQGELEADADALSCPNCAYRWHRKASSLYGRARAPAHGGSAR